MPSNVYRDYTPPAIDRRINEVLNRRAGDLQNFSTETTREQLEKYKKKRVVRQGLLKTTHRHILDIAAFMLETDSNVLEDGILDKDEYIETFNDFFMEGGRRAVLIYYQPMVPPPFDSGRWTLQLAQNSSFIRCCVTDGSTEKFTGKCIIVYRLNSGMEFGTKQLLQEIYYAYTETDEFFLSNLHAVIALMLRVNVPNIQCNTHWSNVIKNAEIESKRKDKFTEDLADFCKYLERIDEDLQKTVQLEQYPRVLREYLSAEEKIMSYTMNDDAIQELERWLKRTIKSIQKVRYLCLSIFFQSD
uniref:Dnahc8_0 protein n=1 Tax=Fopius arisanus TaxID=64838 RepID=A0A0C9S0T9_9HYME